MCVLWVTQVLQGSNIGFAHGGAGGCAGIHLILNCTLKFSRKSFAHASALEISPRRSFTNANIPSKSTEQHMNTPSGLRSQGASNHKVLHKYHTSQ